MTSWRDSSGRPAADARGAGLVTMRDAVLDDRVDDFGVRTPLPDGVRDRMRDDAWIDAATDDHAGMRIPVGFRCIEIARRRHPRRQLEEVGERADGVDVDAEVRLGRAD